MHANDVRQKGTDTRLDQEPRAELPKSALYTDGHTIWQPADWYLRLKVHIGKPTLVDGETNSPEKPG